MGPDYTPLAAMSISDLPAFTALTVMTLILTLNVMLLWISSGFARYFTRTVINPEDKSLTNRNPQVVDSDPAAVARVLRAHRNAMDNIVPFVLVAALYTLANAPAQTAAIVFGVFTGARILHSILYLAGLQPWRSLIYIVSLIDFAVLMALTARQVLGMES